MATKRTKRSIFEAHGVIFSGESGDQLIGNCPFTGKDDKFYVNRRTWLWDSKTAGLSGNVHSFLRRVSERYTTALTDTLLKRLASQRQLPVIAFRGWDIGWDAIHRTYTIPVRDIAGNVVDIRYYRLGKMVKSTPGVQVGLLGAHRMSKDPSARVFICEGEWDAIALKYMLRSAKQPGVVVALPGAGTFKPEWASSFRGREVISLFDKDEAGEQGEHILQRRLFSTVQRIGFVHWPNDMPTGFDVRDWVIAHQEEGMNLGYANLMKLVKPVPKTLPAPRFLQEDGTYTTEDEASTLKPAQMETREYESKWKTPPRLTEVMGVFRKWLHLESTDAINIMLGCVASQAMDGPPVWVFLVGPPGSAKTAVLASLNTYQKIYSTSSLTVHALISGANWKDSADPSLIPRLNGTVMVIKDFTSILSMRDTEKDEIFGILRDSYDGK